MPGKFELHKVERDSAGKERYIKTSEEDAMFKAKMTQMAGEAAAELKDLDFASRLSWLEKCKQEGNEKYRLNDLSEANDLYLKALYGVESGKDLSSEEKAELTAKFKVPILNNLAQILIKQKKYNRAI